MKTKGLKVKELTINQGEVGYIYLPGHPHKSEASCVRKTLRLSEFIENYQGTDIYLDIDRHGKCIGIEVVD